MASLLRLWGAVAGAVTALVYAMLAWTFGAPLAAALVGTVRALPAEAAAGHLSVFVAGTIGIALAGYLLLVLGSYVFHALISGAGAPVGWAGPLAYLFVTFPVVLYALTTVVALALVHPAEFIVSLVFVAVFLVGWSLLVTAAYVVAATFAPMSGAVTWQESTARGYMIGVNAAMNGVAASAAYGILLAPLGSDGNDLAVLLTIVVVVVNLLAVFSPIGSPGAGAAAQTLIEAALGWVSWLSPMTWLVTGLGCLLSHATWIAHVLSWAFPSLLPPSTFQVVSASVDLSSGTMLTRGGFVGTLSQTAFDMGSFAFFSPTYTGSTPTEAEQHEIGHALSLAALGSAFHFVGAVDEIVFQRWWDAYPERIAQSNVAGTPRAIVKMWN